MHFFIKRYIYTYALLKYRHLGCLVGKIKQTKKINKHGIMCIHIKRILWNKFKKTPKSEIFKINKLIEQIDVDLTSFTRKSEQHLII